MTPQKIADLENLLSENKISEASILIKSLMSEKMTGEERGESLVNIAAIYLDIMNSINGQYEAALKEAVSALKELDGQQAKKNDADKLKKIREDLK